MTSTLSHRLETYSRGIDATKLNTVDVWTPDTPGGIAESKLWVIYIHGGAWRDPEVDSKSFAPAINVLWSSSSRDSFAGFASINYSLSPYPSHKTIPSTPDDASRNVHHARHVTDVAHGLHYLQDRYKIHNRYILVGHSAGATMAFQLYQGLFSETPLPQPISVLGIAGIYYFEAFVEAHSSIPVYKEIMDNAFPDQTLWREASPYSSRPGKETLWEHAEVIVISRSEDDELVEKEQASLMLERARSIPHAPEKVFFLQASGLHDEIWSSGDILASLVVKTLSLHKTS
ncbi:alpha/beta-hydrolase [Mollisia scopiformis]|uniref:Kynurenine formamidase n=1 Tax=Mollisia scopiformis TaxID=149040 RepID=A0A132B690_MOLSC|nr:alpha/beta-hydrolase [Mollisia scopiformis]KUJ07926.1 alpha/beta-hydrolase [Mollisia scopiformis]